MGTSSGIFKQVKYKVEATYGTVPAAASAQMLRRVSSDLDLNKDTYESNEIRPDFQVADMRHGVRRVAGGISGELSAGTYKDFIAAALKKAWAATTAITGLSVTIAGSGPSYTVTRSAGDFLTGGFKVGDVIRLSVGALNAANISKNLLIVALTATVATVVPLNGVALVAEGPIATTTATVIGKKTYVPSTGHTDLSYAIEHWYSDVPASEVFSGCKVNQIAFDLPPTGMATVKIDFMGKDVVTSASEYFTAPTAVTTTGCMAAVNGVLRINGATVADVTGLSINIAAGLTGDPVVGANTIPNQFPGRVKVSGQFTAYFSSTTMRDLFINETETSLYAVFTADNTAASDFVGFSISRLKVGGAAKNDGETGLVQTFPFTALLNTAGGAALASDATTITVQDSQA